MATRMEGNSDGSLIEIESGSVKITVDGGAGTILIEAGSEISLDCSSVKITDAPSQKVVLGDLFNSLLNIMLTVLAMHTHPLNLTMTPPTALMSVELNTAVTAFQGTMDSYLSQKVEVS